MATRRESGSGGRMLFTDFDASDKGRPHAAIPDPDPADGEDAPERGGWDHPPQTLEELASSLDLDFEDDWGDGAVTGRSSGAFPPGVDDFLDSEIVPERRRRAAPEHSHPRSFHEQPHSSSRSSSEREDTTRYMHPSPMGDVDAFEASGVASSRRDDPAPSAFDDAEGEDDWDILSALPPFTDEEDGVHTPFEGEWRGHRLGVRPPRAHSYGGIRRLREWYRPPEEEGGEADASGPWYEPPDDADAFSFRSGERGERTEAYPRQNPAPHRDVPADDDGFGRGGRTSRRAAALGPRSPDTSARSLFNDVDLDAAWEARLNREEAGEEADGRTVRIAAGEPASERGTETSVGDAEIAVDGTKTDRAAATRKTRKRETRRNTTAAIPQSSADSDLDFLDDADESAVSSAPEEGVIAETGNETNEGDEYGAEAATSSSGEPAEPERHEDGPAAPEADFIPEAFLSSLDYDDIPPVDDNIQAPIIDDSAIAPFRGPEQTDAGEDEPAPDAEGAVSVVGAAPLAETAGESVSDGEAAVGVGGASGAKEGEAAAKSAASVAVDPADVFSNMNEMDFSGDGLDDEMAAMLKDDDPEPAANGEAGAVPGEARPGKARGWMPLLVRRALARMTPRTLFDKLQELLAWRENWWFYCDLLAAFIATVSLAVIISYFIWYKQ